MKVLRACLAFIFALSLPLLFLTSNLRLEVNALRLYQYGFDKYNVSAATGLDRSELTRAARELIHYFNSREEPIQVRVRAGGEDFELFNKKEQIHLKDVKGLVRLDYAVQRMTLAYVLGYILASLLWGGALRRGLARKVLWGSALTLGLMLLLGVVNLFGFDQFFLGFHLVSFSNELWMLDPSKDFLIRMFPEGFFYDAALLLALLTAAEALVVGGIAWGFTRRWRS